MSLGAFSSLALCLMALVFLVGHGRVASAEAAPRERGDGFTVCLPRNAWVIAGRRLTGGSGFDYHISQKLADAMDRPLHVVWYENELEEESDPVKETYAMLAYGLCDAVPGHPRSAPAVGDQDFDRAALPRWLGMTQDIDPDTGLLKDKLAGYVDVQPIAVTQGYMRSEVGLVYRDGTPEPTGLDDLNARSLHVQQGTLSGVIAMMQTSPVDRAAITTHNPSAGFLWEVESGDGTLAIVDDAAFDSHLKSNPFTTLRLAQWRHPIGMDIGVAVLAERHDLLKALNIVISELPQPDVIHIAAEVGLSYAKPTATELTPSLTLQMLREQR